MLLRLLSGWVAVIAIAAMSVGATPAAAAGEDGAVAGAKLSSPASRHAPRGMRLAAPYRVAPMRHHYDCSGVWCGRQFVLMVGVAY